MRRQKDKKRRGQPAEGPDSPRARKVWSAAATLAVLLALAAVLIVPHVRRASPRSGRLQSSPPAKVIPDEKGVFAAYAGSASCKNCHEEAYDLWKTSNHALAERRLAAARDEPAFQPSRTFQHGTQHTDVGFANGQYQVVALGPAKRYEPFTVERVIGHDPLRQFLVQFPGGRYQALEASYDPRANEWFNVYGNEDRQPGEWGHWTGRGMNWNDMCAACHNTRVRKNYDERTDSYRTTMAEMRVGCESCHGPMKAHNQWQQQFGKSGRKDPTMPRWTQKQTLDNCAFCHARRNDLTGDFKPGDDFFDHMRLTIVDGSDVFYPDGQVREEGYEFSAFLGSRMHHRGVSCLECHNPHSMKTILPGNWLCIRCHIGTRPDAPAIDPVAHSHHKVFGYDTNGVLINFDLMTYKPKETRETGGECVNCHMPQTVYMQRHWRHDHGFTVPDPLLTKQHGIPNACNRCHQDKDAEWSVAWVEKWYGPKMDRPARRRAQLIASARNGNATARDDLLNLLATEEIPYWRAVGAGLLGPWSGEPAVTAALLRGLADTNALVRAECVRGLEPLVENGNSGASAAIGQRLEDPVRSVRVAAAWALRSTVSLSSRAGSELLHSLDLHADQPVGQMQKGSFAFARNEPQQGLAHFQKAVERDPNSAPIRHELAVALSVLNRSAEAVAELEAAARLDPRNAEYSYKLGLAWNEVGDTAKTIASLETAVRLDPSHAPAWYNLGLALSQAGRSEDALLALVRAESVAPADPRNPYARATILARLGRLEEARQAARRALEIQPDFAAAREFLRSLP
jgi:tetratricopeptide (TPR) repeat protein